MEEKHIWQTLDSKVLAVATINYNNSIVFDWAAYIGAVPGITHQFEYESVAKEGSKLSKKLAAIIFPNQDINKYRE